MADWTSGFRSQVSASELKRAVEASVISSYGRLDRDKSKFDKSIRYLYMFLDREYTDRKYFKVGGVISCGYLV